jgi:tRNA(fMet)-specific endonuclease VapC
VVKRLDTNGWIGLGEGERKTLERVRGLDAQKVARGAVVRAELMFNLAHFASLLEPFVSLPFDDAAANQYGLIRAQLERAGTPIGNNDLKIAAIALVHDCAVVTRNGREFQRVAGLRVEDLDD